jgi:hypothetical protein
MAIEARRRGQEHLMNVDLDVEELVSRCVAIVVCYYHFARTWKEWVAIVAKIQTIAEEAEALEVPYRSIDPPLLRELTDRFDQETADRLSREFAHLFAVISSSSPAIVGHP